MRSSGRSDQGKTHIVINESQQHFLDSYLTDVNAELSLAEYETLGAALALPADSVSRYARKFRRNERDRGSVVKRRINMDDAERESKYDDESMGEELEEAGNSFLSPAT